MVYVGYVCGWMCTAKTTEWNELKLSTVVVLETSTLCRSLLIWGSKGQGLGLGFRVTVRVRESAPICISRLERVHIPSTVCPEKNEPLNI